jgi:hypothetical protein
MQTIKSIKKDKNKNRTVLYSRWDGILQRCNNIHNSSYHKYGGRGISVCEKWLKYAGFKEDMEKSFQEHSETYGVKNTTIDRIDVNGDYCKENCRWATYKEQANNTRTNRNLTYEGRTQTMQEWSEETGIMHRTLWGRINGGWSVKRALTEKPSTIKIFLELNGVKKSLKEWAEELNIHYDYLYSRYKIGWDDEKILTTSIIRQ